jgi:hypothetical protein
MKAVFLVFRITGEYDDYREEVVWAFETAGECNGFCDRANAWLKENGLYYGSAEARIRHRASMNKEDNPFPPNPYDPEPYYDYTGTRYMVSSATYYEPPSV